MKEDANMSNEIEVRLVSFPPGSFVEVDDPLTGKRHLALVSDSGNEFIDFVDNDKPATPFPILDALDPKPWGDYSIIAAELVIKGDFAAHTAYSELLTALCDTPAVADPLTLNRAAKWAFESGNYDAAEAAKAGVAATLEARARQEIIAEKATTWIESGVV
jgi:hypothetical protein